MRQNSRNLLRAALAVSKTPLGAPAAPAPAPASPPAFVKTVEDTLGRKGQLNGGVLAFGIPRAEAITEDGMTLTAPQGVAESINFQETTSGQVATTGDFVLKAEEVNPVISALEEHNIQVTALHSHMLTEEPRTLLHALLGHRKCGVRRSRYQGCLEPRCHKVKTLKRFVQGWALCDGSRLRRFSQFFLQAL